MKEDIEELVNKISQDLQILEDKLRHSEIEKVDIRFPRGYLRKASNFRKRLYFIKNETLKRNLAYHFMLSDVYRWILNRFDLSLTAKEMIIKEGLALLGNIMAAIVKEITSKIDPNGNKHGVKASITVLVEREIITEELGKDLKWLWGVRCKEHIENLKDWEYQKYSLNDYNKAIKIWHALEDQLNNACMRGN